MRTVSWRIPKMLSVTREAAVEVANFRTSARSVDMLGRQQIAGIPTAVSEIFKNAYDAYATTVRGDFFPEDRVLMIRDDGVGMSSEDFMTRWLTVGTDSKAAGSRLPAVQRPDGAAVRRLMGEKGIGRLAIASTGPQLLLISRPLRSRAQASDHVVVSLVQWTFFEIPGLNLEDIVVPVRVLSHVDQIDGELLNSMRREISDALTALEERIPREFALRIENELNHLDFDPRKYLALNGPSPARRSGTAFIVKPISDDVDSVMEIQESKSDEFSVSEFQRFMLGFTNTITPSPATPEFITEFIRHDSAGIEDIIDPGAYFWGEDDFRLTDHTIEGSFDQYGTFSGSLSIYGQDPQEIITPWRGSSRGKSACGSFKVKFGYVQGKASESRLAADDFAHMVRRLDKIGGLYVYRDGVRVLPYGNSDNDYLEIEKRRSLNAASAYFSYRRMFGAIDIDAGANSQLQEKAGREGFRENRAYRDFRDILKSFLIQLAADFFSAKSETSEEWRDERLRLQRHSLSRAAQEKAEKKARERFSAAVSDRINYIESGRLTDDVLKVVEDSMSRLTQTAVLTGAPDVAETEQFALVGLRGVRDYVSVTRPENLPLDKESERDWKSFLVLKALADETINRASRDIEGMLYERKGERASSDGVNSTRRARKLRLDSLAEACRSEVSDQAGHVQSRAHEIGGQIANAARNEVAQFDEEMRALLNQVGEDGLSEELLLSNAIRDMTTDYVASLRLLAGEVHRLSEGAGDENQRVVLKEQVLDLQEQIDANLELLQLGQAVQVVSHEFDASIRSVRAGLKKLGPWARSTPRLQPVVRDLRASFAHLDGYLRLFTPLQRRLYREAVVMSGHEVESFVTGVFSERMERHSVRLDVTDEFRSWNFAGYPSTFYPVFVNLVDNAIHWVSSESREQPTISLEADETALYVRDNGPGVRPRDREAIFERGFGRRRGGRGLGLSLAHELLNRDGWDLDLIPSQVGATFRLSRRISVGDDSQ